MGLGWVFLWSGIGVVVVILLGCGGLWWYLSKSIDGHFKDDLEDNYD